MKNPKLIYGDITKFDGDAIVNPANSTLMGGGGVDGAIHRSAGFELAFECRTLGGCQTGQAKVTKGYRLHAKYVIHTVGPIWRGGSFDEEKLLKSCYNNSVQLALDMGLKTIAFPLISSGAYGFPLRQAIQVAISTLSQFDQSDIDISLYAYDSATFDLVQEVAQEL